MSFPVGELLASIRMEGLQQFVSDNQTARREFENTGGAGRAAGQAAKAAWDAARVTIGGLTVTAAAYATNLIKTGAAYNTLQQTSRAALTTILGGSKAAADQMAKLDDFARNSPFSKAVFISAQQQLLGFGVEAKKIIPILGAVEDAVAATGGSSSEIASVVEVLAKIQSQGKITGEELLQLGGRGIDAAGLIGESLGKTGAQIKESITKGKLDAEVALDALVEGMERTYGGAAANVKATWDGARDRIKAANREIGAALAEPFISQKGGGLAIIWGNQVADILRAALTHAKPLTDIVTSRLAPGFADITTGLDTIRVVVKSWDSARFEEFLENTKQYAPLAAGGLGALLGMVTSLASGLPVIGPLAAALGPIPLALVAMSAASTELRSAFGEVLAIFQPLVPVAQQVAEVFANALVGALPTAATLLIAFARALTPLIELLGSLPPEVLAAVAAFFAMNRALTPATAIIEKVWGAIDRVIDGMALLQVAGSQRWAELTAGGMSKLGAGLEVAKGGALGLASGLKGVVAANPVGFALMGVAAAVGVLTMAFAAQAEEAQRVATNVKNYKDSLDQTNAAITTATAEQAEKNLVDAGAIEAAEKIGISRKTLIDATLGEADAIQLVKEAYRQYAGTVQKDGITQAKEFNSEAGLVMGTLRDQQRALEESQRELKREAEAAREAAAAMSDAGRSNARLNDALAIARDVSKDATERLKALKQALDELNGGTKTAAELQRDLNETQDRLGDAFGQTDENGKKLVKSLVDQAGAIDTSSAAGRTLFDEVNRLNDQMLDAILLADAEAKARGEVGVSMEEATKAAAPYIQALKDAGGEAKLTDDQIAGMIGSMLDTPSLVQFLISDDGTIDAATQGALTLSEQLQKTPDKRIKVDAPDVPGVIEELKDMGYKVKTLPDGKIVVAAKGINSTEEALTHLARQRIVRFTVVRDGDPIPATTSSGKYANERGGLYNAGEPQAFEQGGGTFPSGIYKGRPGGIHKFAEESLPWEAYISPHPAYRKRNQDILREAAARLGGVAAFEGGGIRAFAGGGTSGRWSLSAEDIRWFRDQRESFNRAAKRGELRQDPMSLVDRLLAVAENAPERLRKSYRKAALNSEEALVRLEKKSEDAAEKVDDATDKLVGLRDASKNMASSVAAAIKSFFSVGDLNKTTTTKSMTIDGQKVDLVVPGNGTTGASIAKSMKLTASKIRKFALDLKKLAARRGFPPALLEEIASLGVEEGQPIVSALLSATTEEIASIAASYGTITKASNYGGKVVADDNYAKLITTAENQLKSAREDAAKIREAIRAQADRLITNLGAALRAGAGAQKKALGGPIQGPGTRTSDSVLIWASNDEHMASAAEVDGFGGHAKFAQMRALARQGLWRNIPRYRDGGPILSRYHAPANVASTMRSGPAAEVTIMYPIVKDLE